jgi:hypothetical protein
MGGPINKKQEKVNPPEADYTSIFFLLFPGSSGFFHFFPVFSKIKNTNPQYGIIR